MIMFSSTENWCMLHTDAFSVWILIFVLKLLFTCTVSPDMLEFLLVNPNPISFISIFLNILFISNLIFLDYSYIEGLKKSIKMYLDHSNYETSGA